MEFWYIMALDELISEYRNISINFHLPATGKSVILVFRLTVFGI